MAIFYVFLGHANGLAAGPYLLRHVAFSDAVTAFDGVAMLFCLSGFLLSGPFIRAYLDGPADLPLVRQYLLARFLRIYPLYASAVLLIALYLRWRGGGPTFGDVALHLALLQDFSLATIQSLSGPLWTMPLDVQFYIFLPLCFWVGVRLLGGAGRRTRIVALTAALALLVAISIAYRWFVVWRFSPVGIDEQLFVVDQFPGMVGLFALGIAAQLAIYLLHGAMRARSSAVLLSALIGVAIALRSAQYGSHAAWQHYASSLVREHAAAFASIDVVLGGIGCACLLIAANYAGESWFGRIAASPLVAYAAAISYGFYLFHFTVVEAVREHVRGQGAVVFGLLAASSIVVLVPLCTATHVAIEKVFLTYKARLQRYRTVSSLAPRPLR